MIQQEIDRIQQDWIELHAVGQCLHVGCGEKYIPGAVNIDPNPDRIPWRDNDWDVHDLPVTDACFDSVVSSHVLQALRDPVAALREMARVLKPGGMMAHVIPDHRYAPVKRDPRFQFDYMWNVWHGPEEFRPVMAKVSDLLRLAILEEFPQFHWSFRVLAVKRSNVGEKVIEDVQMLMAEMRGDVGYDYSEI